MCTPLLFYWFVWWNISTNILLLSNYLFNGTISIVPRSIKIDDSFPSFCNSTHKRCLTIIKFRNFHISVMCSIQVTCIKQLGIIFVFSLYAGTGFVLSNCIFVCGCQELVGTFSIYIVSDRKFSCEYFNVERRSVHRNTLITLFYIECRNSIRYGFVALVFYLN